MKVPELIDARQSEWAELDRLVRRARTRGERLDPAGVYRLGALYRSVSADLAVARRIAPGDPLAAELERLVVAARGVVYERVSRRLRVREFMSTTYWQLLFERRGAMAAAAIMMVAPAVLAFLWASARPDTVSQFLPPAFLWVKDAATTDQGYGTVGIVAFSLYVMTNNIRVTLLSFALGITWGLGTVFVVAQNGLVLGGVAGLAAAYGNADVFIAAVAAHGILELSCIVVGGGAGLSVGKAILRPGTRTRRAALASEAVSAARVALGTAPWLVIAGLLEGFASRTGRGPVFAVLVGVVVGGGYWFLAFWRGRPIPDR
jgi:uncharacterized membrane protein SpoIIM required for sporulation